MNSKYSEFSISFFPPIHEVDANGIKYTKEAVIDACEEADGLPVTAYNANGDEIVIGVADRVRYEDGRINVNGRLFRGGTTEYVKQTFDLDTVVKCKFASITLC